MSRDVHAIASERLQSMGQRYSAKRQAIVAALDEAGRPLTIPQLLNLRTDLAQSSAYRNLSVLEQAGVVHRIVTSDDHARYELAEELTHHHHHHLICTSCGAVDDFTVPPALERSLEGELQRVARRTGFTGDHHQLDLVGRCARCG